MRWYDIVYGIILILSIIDFALTAPVLVQDKRKAYVDAVHIPKDVTTVLGKRGYEQFKKLAEDYFEKWGKPVWWPEEHASTASSSSVPSGNKKLDEFKKQAEDYFAKGGKPDWSSNEHGSSSSAPPVTDHGPTNDVKTPAPNPSPLPVHPDPLSPLPIAHSMPVAHEDAQSESDYEWLYESDGESHVPVAHSMPVAQGDAQSESDYEWLYDGNGEPLIPIASDSPTSTSSGSAHGLTGPDVLQPNPNKRPSTGPDPDFVEGVQQQNPGSESAPNSKSDWYQLPSLKRPKLASSEEFSQAHEDQVQQPNPGHSADPPLLRPALPEALNQGPLRPADGHPILMPPPPYLPELSPTEVNSYSYPSPDGFDLGPLWLLDGHPIMTAPLPPPHPLSSTEDHSYSYLGPVVHPQPPGARSTMPENEVVSSITEPEAR